MASNESYKFEQCRINQLHEERLYIQKKTFTKWMNSFLMKAKMEVDDIFVDLADGKKLLKLLEIISGEKLGKPNNGKMRVHKIENVNKCLTFLHTKVKLESIGAEDIVDGNKTLILGLLWTIILRFQIQDIEIEMDDENDSKKHSSKEALLLWCQRKTKGYRHVHVNDFTNSWRDGMAFNALIHSQRPELIDYEALIPENHIDNLNQAFEVAQKHLAIQPLLDSEDVDTAKPDERSILTYVSSYYHTFARYNSEAISGKRITNIISQLMEIDRCQLNYEMYTTNLLNWIKMKIFALNNRDFPNNLEGIQTEFIAFKEYRTVEKPPKYKERSEIEALLFNVQTKMKALRQSPYIPPEGKLVHDIQKSWNDLEKAEHKRELALREEMIRLEKLNNLAKSFFRKSEIRKNYLKDMIQVLNDPRYGINLSQVEATVKKHEAICVDILSRSERIESLSQMVRELDEGNYHNLGEVTQIETDIKQMWDQMLLLLKQHQNNLSSASNFMSSKKEIETIESELNELKSRILLDSNAGHLRAAEEYLQTHSLMEAQIASHSDTVKRLTNTANKLMKAQSHLVEKEIPLLKQGIDSLNETYSQLIKLAADKRDRLIKSRDFYRFLQDIDEEDAALSDKQNICQAILPGKDLLAIISLQQKHNVFEAEVKSHQNRVKLIEKRCQELSPIVDNDRRTKMDEKLKLLLDKWNQLMLMTNQKSKELADAIEAFQYHADANEAESWLREKMQLARSEDYGNDEPSAISLLQRHSRLENEIKAYQHDIDRLNNQSDKMINSGVENLFLLCDDPFLTRTFLTNETQIDKIPESESTEPTVTMTEVWEEVQIPQVVVLYKYIGSSKYPISKGEILFLLEKTTNEWWNVKREGENVTGFVPANYVKEIEPKIVRKLTQKPIEEKPKRFENNKSKYNRRNSKRRLSIVAGTETLEQRKNRINSEYSELNDLCHSRRESLEESVKLFRFNRECETLESWIANFEKAMITANNDDPVNTLSQQFEKFITDLLANRSRLDSIDKMAKEIHLPAYLPQIKRRQETLHKKWDNLTLLQKQLGKNIEGLSTVEVFNAASDEAAERIADKLAKINNTHELGHDLKTVRSLQRRHENIERELVPIEDSLKKIVILSDNVKSSYPLQRKHVENRLSELNQMWEELKECSVQKRTLLDKMIGLQILKNSSGEVLMWINNYVRPMLQYDEQNVSQKDLVNLDLMCKEHHDILLEIKGKSNDVNDLKELSQKLATQVPPEEIVVVNELIQQYENIYRDWQEKENFLNQCCDLVAFNQEADHLETIINSNMAYLDFDNLGENVTDVISLARQHENFMNTLKVQDQRVHNFLDIGEKLIQKRHFDSAQIENRRQHVAKRCKDLRDKSFARGQKLEEARIYQEIKADTAEFLNWCTAKEKLIDDNELRHMNNMERKLKRHQAFEAEVRANQSQLDKIVRTVSEVNKNSHYASNELNVLCAQVREQWNRLIELVENKNHLFSQAFEQIEHTKSLNLIEERVVELSQLVHSTDYGVDRRTCKILMSESRAAENEIAMLEQKLNSLDDKGQMIAADHYNSDDILKCSVKLSEQLSQLKAPFLERQKRLKASNQFHQFEYDVNAELQWIKEHLVVAESVDIPQNLTEAQSSIKKFEQNFIREVEGHDNYVNKVVQSGQNLIEQDHFASKEIEAKIEELENEWKHLLTKMVARHKVLKTTLTIQQFLSECSDIESWISEKMNVLNGPIYGKDEITVVKLLQKQKTTDLEIDTYKGLIDELARQAEQLDNDSDDPIYKNRTNELHAQIKRLHKLNNERSSLLVELKRRHEFYRESTDFLNWITYIRQTLSTEDYGKDYEHCNLLQSKFFDLKRSILSNEERFKQCEDFATSLASKNDDDHHEINTTMDTIRNAWNELLKLVNIREQNFIAANRIHRFNRDNGEAFERIKEKSTILNNQDLGRDTHSAQNLIRKHVLFQNDLVVLEAQLQVLINDSVKLQAAYPGGNADNISEQLTIVVNHWEKLKEKSEQRRNALLDSEAYFRFIAAVRNLDQWATNLLAELQTFETVRDIQSSQALKVAHERLKLEIDSREDEFGSIVVDANSFAKKPFYSEVKLQTELLLANRNAVHNAWQLKNVYLDQLIDLNCFHRDIKQLDHLCQQHQNRLASNECGTTVEEADSALKKFDNFIKVFHSHEPKFSNVNDCGRRLIEKEHFDSKNIEIILNELLKRREKLLSSISERREELSDALIAVQFKRDVQETELWIDEKQKQIVKEQQVAGDQSIEQKMKRLQKHQTFEAEINANASRITDIQDKARHLIKKNHPSSIEIRSEQDNLLKKWESLVLLSRDILKGFEEAKDIYDFDRNIEQIESWIREKETMIHFADTGEDYEHCQSLLKKLDDVGTDMKVDEDRILLINNLANKLNHQCKNELFNEDKVNKQRDTLNDNWQRLQRKIAEYRNRLLVSLEIHSLNRDLDDINERVLEKDALVSKECDAKSLQSVESLQRKHEATLNEILAIEYQFKNINENDARRLISKYPELTEKSRIKIQNVQENLRKLNQDCKSKGNELEFAILMHKFFDSIKEIEHWSNDILSNKLGNVSTSVSVVEAKNDLRNHEYVKAEIAGRRDNHQYVKEHGLALLQQIEQEHLAPEEKAKQIESCVEKIDQLRQRLDQAWEEKHSFLKQCLEMRTFNDLSKLCDSWLASKEAFLANEDLGTNLIAVENLLKKHDTFVKSLAAQQRVVDMFAYGENLINKRHNEFESIQKKLNEAQKRREKLQELSELRRNQLDHSKMYFNFHRNVNETQRWLNEKLKVATDESYRDSINLLSKIQRHAAFEAEILANRERINLVVHEGETLIGLNHIRSDEIKEQLSELDKLMRNLTENTTLKRTRLNEAYHSLQFFRLCDDLELWIKDIDNMLRNEDRGKDLTSIKNLLKKHQLVESDVHNHVENIEQLKDHLLNFQQSNHFLKDEIEDRAQQIIKSYNSIHEPMNKRREILEEYLEFYQFKRDVEDELLWIREKETQISQFDNVSTLMDIQRLLKRLKMLELELQTREPHLNTLASKGHNLIKSSHNNSEEIKTLTYELQNRFQHIKDKYAFHRLHLYDSLELQQFFADIVEAEAWINERMPMIQSEDIGQDEESVSTLMKKLDVVTKDTDRFNTSSLDRLIKQSKTFAEKNHSDLELINERIDSLQKHFNLFEELIDKRRLVYQNQREYFIFERDADELVLWIMDQLIVANSEDYGQDVEHVEKLIQQFDTFAANVNANEERIVAIEAEAKNVHNCQAKLEQVKKMWNELREATIARQEALQGAKKVHTFYQSADETICWIREKESNVALDKVNVNYDDLDTIQAKIRQLDGFDRDLDAVGEQVVALMEEANNLAASFPDIKNEIDGRKNNVEFAWNRLNEMKRDHMERLKQIETIQSYFDEYRELITWINEMQALITADDRLGSDVLSAEEQLNRHKEYKMEIDTRNDIFANFLSNGDHIIAQKHFMADEIADRNQRIRFLHSNLIETWTNRLTLYEYNVDARQFIQDSEQVDKWIDAHLPFINDDHYGDSLAEVEDLLQKHQEFEKTVDTQRDKLKSIERITMIERFFDEQKLKEEQARIAEANEREKERMQQLVQEEQMKIRSRQNEEEARLYENANFLDQKQKQQSTKSPKRHSSFAFSRKSKTIERSPPVIRSEIVNLPIACEGFLERKRILQVGGKKATSRSWKTYYTVLCGQMLCFFKDKNTFYSNVAASPPIPIYDAQCGEVSDYSKRKNVFSILLKDHSKYYFSTNDSVKMRDWCNKITFRAQLPPHQQLQSIETINATGSGDTQSRSPYSHSEKSASNDHESIGGSSRSSSSRKSSFSSPINQFNGHQTNGNSHYQHNQYDSTSPPIPSKRISTPSSIPLNGKSSLNHYNNSESTYQNIPVNKYMSLPPNMAPPSSSSIDSMETKPIPSTNSTVSISKSSEGSLDGVSLNNEADKKKSKKRRSFFRRK
ncbi:hypothetical protein RDWZM_008423 [Blomia tropicalis]|uniref:Uncharacterized protein n=1 Tax=Blomia tropicalis TaxID=40697 RepID=A0A9Q0RK24_BLOTA|nr:hypothetical protein RDWZM_008423 [Blomia tropicalis]